MGALRRKNQKSINCETVRLTPWTRSCPLSAPSHRWPQDAPRLSPSRGEEVGSGGAKSRAPESHLPFVLCHHAQRAGWRGPISRGERGAASRSAARAGGPEQRGAEARPGEHSPRSARCPSQAPSPAAQGGVGEAGEMVRTHGGEKRQRSPCLPHACN